MAPLSSLWVSWFARLYDTFMRPIESMTLRALRQRLLVEMTGDVLEIGVGTGINLAYMAAVLGTGRVNWTATDPNPAMLDLARRAAGRMSVRFEAAAAEALPFPDASFDKVVATLVLCSVEDPRRTLAEVRRVLRPNGELLLIEHVRGEGIGGHLQDWLTPMWAVVGAGCRLNRCTPHLLRLAGFDADALEAHRVPFPLLRLVVGRLRVKIGEKPLH